jgi:hypothetical protein
MTSVEVAVLPERFAIEFSCLPLNGPLSVVPLSVVKGGAAILEDCSGNVKDSGEPDVVAGGAQQHAVQDLPDETLVFLLGSRYCETDRLSDIAWSLFGNTPP